MERGNLDLEAWLRDADRDLIASVEEDLDLDAMLVRVRRTAAELKIRRTAASTTSGGLVMDATAAAIGRFFRGRPDEWSDDLTVCESTRRTPSKVYPVVRQFIEAGWLEERWEAGVADGEPRRKFYRVTQDGLTGLGLAVAEYEQTRRVASQRFLGEHRPQEA